MIDIPLNANVECVDGLCGHSTYVVIDPETQQLTHVVVEEKWPSHEEHLVPVDKISETCPDVIRLLCTRDELARQDNFVATYYATKEIPRFKDIGSCDWPFAVQKDVWVSPVKYRRIPKGELVVHSGAHAEASDGHAGQVREFLVDPVTKRITHLVLRTGHLWHKQDVAVSASQIDQIRENEVSLKLDKRGVLALSAMPIEGRRGA